MSQVIEKGNIKEEFLENLEDFDIELFPISSEKVPLEKGIEPIERFILNYRGERIGFMMIIPKDKLSDEESVEIYLDSTTPLTAVEILEVLQDEYLHLLRIEFTLSLLRR